MSLQDARCRASFAQTNPKRQGSAAAMRYEGYKRSRTVGEALAAGALRGDLSHDQQKGYLRLGPGAPGPLGHAPRPEAPAGDPGGQPRSGLEGGPGPPADGFPQAPWGAVAGARSLAPAPEPPASWSPGRLGGVSGALVVGAEAPAAERWRSAAGPGAAPEAESDSEEELRRLAVAREAAIAVASAWSGAGAGPGSCAASRPAAPEPEEGLGASGPAEPGTPDTELEDPAWLEERGFAALGPAEPGTPDTELEASPRSPGDSATAGEAGGRPPTCEPLDVDDGAGETITLRCRLGLVTVVKQEPDAEERQADPQAARSSQAPLLSPVEPLPRGTVLQMLLASRDPAGAGAPSVAKAPDEGAQAQRRREEDQQQAAAAFEEAQIASYEANVVERSRRESSELDELRRGSLEPLHALDKEWMHELYESSGVFEFLEGGDNRLLLHHFLRLQGKAARWYGAPAEAYFAAGRQRLLKALRDDESPSVLAGILSESIQAAERSIFMMPEKGAFLPEIFCAAGAATARRDCGLVELE